MSSPQGSFEQRRDLLFVGACSHTPNRDAIEWFSKEVFPAVRAELPDVVFNVVSAHAPPEIAALESRHAARQTELEQQQQTHHAELVARLAALDEELGIFKNINDFVYMTSNKSVEQVIADKHSAWTVTPGAAADAEQQAGPSSLQVSEQSPVAAPDRSSPASPKNGLTMVGSYMNRNKLKHEK